MRKLFIMSMVLLTNSLSFSQHSHLQMRSSGDEDAQPLLGSSTPELVRRDSDSHMSPQAYQMVGYSESSCWYSDCCKATGQLVEKGGECAKVVATGCCIALSFQAVKGKLIPLLINILQDPVTKDYIHSD